MIKSIHIKNYILIDESDLDFSDGLNVITGETGAGKTILISAIDAAFGAKISSDVIKKNCEKAIIELTLENKKHDLKQLFEENGIDDFEEIIITREITKTSSRTRINGTLVNQNFIKDFKDMFLDIHSQHQTYAFMQPKTHINLLDNYAKDVYGEDLEKYKKLYFEYLSLQKELEIAKNSANATESQIDFLKFQIEEIENAAIEDIDEEDKLNEELKVLENAEKLKELTYGAYWALNGEDGSLSDAITQIKINISKAKKLDNSLENAENTIIEISELARELSSNLRDYSQSVTNNTERLDEIQERLFVLDKIKRKYGGTLEDVLKTYEKLSTELNGIEFSTKNADELKAKIEKILKDLNAIADKITESRRNCGELLSSLIVDELEKLELAKSGFEIKITPCDLCQSGKDNVEFYISTNVSQDLSPLAKTASGGEISRVMLAIKTVFANADDIDTVIFDEIDTGISGKAAQSVADEIEQLAKFRQIILITHQAIIAAKADRHILVSKEQGDTTSVEIKILDENEKINALASLASGVVSDSAIEFAKSLIREK